MKEENRKIENVNHFRNVYDNIDREEKLIVLKKPAFLPVHFNVILRFVIITSTIQQSFRHRNTHRFRYTFQ